MNISLSVVVLAAGESSRFKSSLSKVLHSIAGRPLLSLILQVVKNLSNNDNLKILQTIIIAGQNKDQLKSTLPADQATQFVFQDKPLGTGHAVQCALPYLTSSSHVLILLGDTPLISSATLEKLILTTPENSIGMLTSKVENPTGLGRIIRDSNNQENILKIIEEKDANPDELNIHEINAGIYFVPKNLLNKWLPNLTAKNTQNEYYLTDIVAMAVKDNIKIHSILVDEHEIQGINNRVQLAAAERQVQLCQAKQYMLNGVTLLDPNRFDVRGDVEIQPDVTIDVNVILEGLNKKTIIESNVLIEPNVIIRDSHIKSGSRILANSIIDSAIINNNCQVGPFARIRPGTILKNQAKVGNFVEIKQSTLGTNSKVNHLSYLGDAEIGSEVNIGAGTITCNYDGENKYKTIIGDNVFIGSSTQLIAPVTIGKDATIAAGTTLTKDAPSGKLTLTKKIQTTVLDWVRPKKIKEV